MREDTPKKEQPVEMQLLPFSIEYNGPAEVSQYFQVHENVEENSGKTLSSSFRGRPLNGIEICLPEDYTGVVVEDGDENSNASGQLRKNIISTFQKFNYWNWDKPPSANDGVNKLVDWLEIAKDIHSS